jgi:Sugar-transfer associated ATP-grasp
MDDLKPEILTQGLADRDQQQVSGCLSTGRSDGYDQLRIAGALTLLGRAMSFFHRRCLVGFPWFWPSRPLGNQAMVHARRIVRRHYARDHHPIHRALARVLVTAVWPLAVLINLWEIRHSRGPEAVPIKRLPGAFWSAIRYNVVPGEYYAYALWHPDCRANIDNYLYSKEGPRLFQLLNQPLQPDPINDKLAFYEICKARALPTPAILAAFAPNARLLEFGSGHPPTHDLFVKPRIGMGGGGSERFRWQGSVFESNRGRRIRPEDLGDYLETRARAENRTLLVQPALSNHPKLGVDANGALATARLVTGISLDGDVAPLFAFICFGHPNQIVAHGRVAVIDIASGHLTSASQDFSARRPLGHHCGIGWDPACTLPDWETLQRHTKVAHQACSNFVFIGWDAAFTAHGPMLLEGNANWCADVYQSLCGKPLGHTQFASILAERFRALDLT